MGRINLYTKDVQKRMSIKELKRIIGAETWDENQNSKDKGATQTVRDHLIKNINDSPDKVKTLDTEEAMSTKELLSLIENRTTEKQEKLVKKFLSALTLHGYAQFHEATGMRKVLWAIILASMLVFIVRFTYLSYRSENYYKQVIEFETKNVKELDFPTITMCRYSPVYTKSIHRNFPINITEKEFRRFYFHFLSNRSKSRYRLQYCHLLRDLYREGYAGYKEILELFEKHKEEHINNLLVDEVSNRQRCLYENKPCRFSKHFRTVYRHSLQSLCNQFNFYEKEKPGLISIGNDQGNGLFMFWDISGENYYNDYGLNGLLMEIHPYGTPHQLVDHRRFKLRFFI